jgi:hypothetical protein
MQYGPDGGIVPFVIKLVRVRIDVDHLGFLGIDHFFKILLFMLMRFGLVIMYHESKIVGLAGFKLENLRQIRNEPVGQTDFFLEDLRKKTRRFKAGFGRDIAIGERPVRRFHFGEFIPEEFPVIGIIIN